MAAGRIAAAALAKTMFNDIFIPMTGAPADSYALAIAAALAAATGANLTVAEIANLPPPVTGPWDLTPAARLEQIHNELRAKAHDNAAKLRVRLEKEPAVSKVQVIEALLASPAENAALMAQSSDLVVVAGTAGSLENESIVEAFFPALLFGSGRPVLVVPPRCKAPMPPQHVVVGWNATPHTARAVHDALPLLRDATRVDVLAVDAPGETAEVPESGQGIAGHLARHGVTANLLAKESHGHSISKLLIEHAQREQAHLIVVGGYGHSRLREWAVGGVTRELLYQSPLPVLYSH